MKTTGELYVDFQMELENLVDENSNVSGLPHTLLARALREAASTIESRPFEPDMADDDDDDSESDDGSDV